MGSLCEFRIKWTTCSEYDIRGHFEPLFASRSRCWLLSSWKRRSRRVVVVYTLCVQYCRRGGVEKVKYAVGVLLVRKNEVWKWQRMDPI